VVFLKFSVIIEKDEDGYYVASVPELPGCHTQAKTIDELMKRINEAASLYLEVEGSVIEEKKELIGVQFIEVLTSELKTASS
jgi:predicted RNase H-like HicB family nuclease